MSWQRPNIGSRMNREVHVRFWERAEVKFLRATRHSRRSRFGRESACPPISDMSGGVRFGRDVPEPAVSRCNKVRVQKPDLVDHLVGATEHRNGKRETKQFRGSEIDDQLDFCGLEHRKLCRLLVLENLRRIDAELAINVYKAGPVAEQAARHGELAMCRDRWQRITQYQRRQLLAAAVEKRIGSDDKRPNALACQRHECLVDLVIAAGVEDEDLQRETA